MESEGESEGGIESETNTETWTPKARRASFRHPVRAFIHRFFRRLSVKLVTEFSVFALKGAAAPYSELVAAGKAPEEIEQAMGELSKLEGDKLRHFVRSLQASSGKTEGLKRVLVASFAEGEKLPPGAEKIEEHYYVLESFAAPRPAAPPQDARGGKGGRGGRGGGKGGGRGQGGPGRSGGGGGAGGRGPRPEGGQAAASKPTAPKA